MPDRYIRSVDGNSANQTDAGSHGGMVDNVNT